MNPNVWGPHAWFFIETVVLSIPEDTKDTSDYVRFLQSLKPILPCVGCQVKYGEYITTHPIPTERDAIIKWVHDLHNTVRTRCKKNTRTLEDVKAYYSNQMSPTGSKKWLIIGALVLLFIFLWSRFKE